MLELALKWLLAYLLGSLMGALLIGRLKGVDIREQGSGNAGGTNALRTQGKAFALGVVVIDVAKGWFAADVLPALALPGIAPLELEAGVPSRDWLAAGCAAAAVVGHVFPVWFGFRGGKGAATVVGALLGLAPAFVLPALGVWFAVVCTTGFVGFGTTLAMASLPVLAWRANEPLATLCLMVALAVFVAWAHRSNFARMRAGTENRARKLWLFAPKTPATPAATTSTSSSEP
jgi:glycerol-3-phosphate acyltransferase PlsY